MADDRINMTADEFIDTWHQWAPDTLTQAEVGALQATLVNILKAFEERGSVTHGHVVFGKLGTYLYESPDIRKNG